MIPVLRWQRQVDFLSSRTAKTDTKNKKKCRKKKNKK